ncbi:Usp domain-containing protein [Cephalotus follicularis]|uniref:Usp domain-containing protein n=1 Tax=Cephalotus follicularis TaxID=3775 RepID=A0A1Q3ALC2_CEPFO|nr:Usp domain-containing protein [Cephalotus follicularis]
MACTSRERPTTKKFIETNKKIINEESSKSSNEDNTHCIFYSQTPTKNFDQKMARSQPTSSRVSLSRSIARVRIWSPSLRCKPVSSPHETDHQTKGFLSINKNFGGETEFGNGNKVMVVVDSSLDSRGALEWALSHTVQCQDTIVLVHVHKSLKQGAESNGKHNLRAYELLHAMKIVCQIRKPGVQVEVSMLEGKEKGPLIVEEAKRQRVSLLILGQRKKSIMWHLMQRLVGKKRKLREFVNYCIQNASCMTIAVRMKSKKHGGYLITTKRHKKFWLLA